MKTGGPASPLELSGRVPANEDAPRAARDLLGGLDHTFQISEQRFADLHVAVSELVTNAVQHGPADEISIRVAADDTTVRVEIGDAGIGDFDWPDSGRDGHWGLDIVRAFTDRCGIEHRPETLVWCEVDLHRAA